MLLEKERERLLAVLQSRTATHAERRSAREALEREESDDVDAGTAPLDDSRSSEPRER
jgi:hypothetical protein